MKQALVVFITILAGLFLTASSLAQTYYPFPDTGQTKCYNDSAEIACPSPGQPFYGQDAHYQPRIPRSYTKLGYGGTVLPDNARHVDDNNGPWIMTRDNVTGLIWELKTNANRSHTYTWSNVYSNFIAVLNNTKYGGFEDWQLPNIKELSSLVKAAGPPWIDAAYFPKNMSSDYWSSTLGLAGGLSDYAWRVNFNDGYVWGSDMFISYYVRAVRAGQ